LRSGTRQWLVGEAQWQQFRRALARGAWRRALPATPASQPVSLLRSPAAGGASGRMLSCAAHAAWSLLPAAPRSPPAAAPAASPAAAGGSASCWLQQRRGAGTVQSSAGWFGGGAVWGQEVTARECIPYRLQHHPIAACCICQAAVAPIHPPTHPPLTVCAVPSWADSSLQRRSTLPFSVTSVCRQQQGVPMGEQLGTASC
jgi:hypothetical protein